MRDERSRPLVIELETWLREQRAKVSKNSETGKAIDYSLKRWAAFTRFLDDGRLCMSNNAAERELRAVAVGRRNWTFAGSDEGGRRAAAIYTLIATAKLNDVDPAGLARRRARPLAGSSRQAHPRAPALELADAEHRCSGCLINTPPSKPAHPGVFTGWVPLRDLRHPIFERPVRIILLGDSHQRAANDRARVFAKQTDLLDLEVSLRASAHALRPVLLQGSPPARAARLSGRAAGSV